MGGGVLAVHKDIVKEDDDITAKKRVKNVVHSSLKSQRCICETEWHDEKFVVAIMGPESGFVDVIRVDTDLMIPRT